MTNDQIKSAVAAIVLAGVNLLAVLGYKPSAAIVTEITTGLILVASYFAPRISYLQHQFAGAIGAGVGGALAAINLAVISLGDASRGVIAAVSTVLVAVGALFVPSLSRTAES